MITYPFVIVPGDSFIAAIAALEFLVVHVAGEGHAGDHEVVVAEYLRNFFDDVGVETADRRTHSDDR